MKFALVDYILAKIEAVALILWGGFSISSFLVGGPYLYLSIFLAAFIGSIVGNYFIPYKSINERVCALFVNCGIGLVFSLFFQDITSIWMAAVGGLIGNFFWKLKRKWT